MASNAKPVVHERTGEPLRRGARIVDRDGDVWVRANTLWHHQGKGEAWKGRWPWTAVKLWYGPLQILTLNDR